MGCGQKMEYSLSGFLSKLALNNLVVLLIEKIIPRPFPISFAAKCVKLGL